MFGAYPQSPRAPRAVRRGIPLNLDPEMPRACRYRDDSDLHQCPRSREADDRSACGKDDHRPPVPCRVLKAAMISRAAAQASAKSSITSATSRYRRLDRPCRCADIRSRPSQPRSAGHLNTHHDRCPHGTAPVEPSTRTIGSDTHRSGNSPSSRI